MRSQLKKLKREEFFCGGVGFAFLSLFYCLFYLYSLEPTNTSAFDSDFSVSKGVLIAARKGSKYGFKLLIRRDGKVQSYFVDFSYSSARRDALLAVVGKEIEIGSYESTIISCRVDEHYLCRPNCRTPEECKMIYHKVNSLVLRDLSIGSLGFSLVCFIISFFKQRK